MVYGPLALGSPDSTAICTPGTKVVHLRASGVSTSGEPEALSGMLPIAAPCAGCAAGCCVVGCCPACARQSATANKPIKTTETFFIENPPPGDSLNSGLHP